MDSCSAMRANWWTEKTWGCAELSDMLFLPGKAWRDLGRSEYATSVPSGALPTRPRACPSTRRGRAARRQPLRSSRNRPSAIPDIFDGMLAWTFRQDESRRRRGCDVDRGAAIDGAVCRGLVRRLMALRAALEAWGRRKTRRPVDAHDALDAVRRLRAPLWPVRRLLASYSCTGSKLVAAAPTRSCRRAPSVPSLLRLGALLVSEVRRGSAA